MVENEKRKVGSKELEPIRGMFDCEGRQVCEGDIVEYFDLYYAKKEGKPCYGVVKWNEEYFTYEPLIFATDDYNGNCFAHVCKPCHRREKWEAYFKIIGSINTNPELLSSLELTQLYSF